MPDPHVSFRPARKDECRTIAQLYSMASDGVADYIWTRMAASGEEIVDVGARRYAREDTVFSYRNCTVAAIEKRIAGMMVAFPVYEASELDPDIDPVLIPYARLERPNSYYICGMAVLPPYRNRGIGSSLFKLAQERAAQLVLPQLSLIVFESNEGAVRLYRRIGFYEIARQPIVPHPLIRHTGDALLFVKDI